MELILGLPPMSQYDAAASPMYGAFQATPTLAPYTSLPVSRTDEVNGQDAWGAAASLAMNFEEADMTPEYELNENLVEVGPGRELVDAAARAVGLHPGHRRGRRGRGTRSGPRTAPLDS